MIGQWPKSPGIFKQLAKALIRLLLCASGSEPLLVAHTTLLEISCRCSIIILVHDEDQIRFWVTLP